MHVGEEAFIAGFQGVLLLAVSLKENMYILHYILCLYKSELTNEASITLFLVAHYSLQIRRIMQNQFITG